MTATVRPRAGAGVSAAVSSLSRGLMAVDARLRSRRSARCLTFAPNYPAVAGGAGAAITGSSFTCLTIVSEPYAAFRPGVVIGPLATLGVLWFSRPLNRRDLSEKELSPASVTEAIQIGVVLLAAGYAARRFLGCGIVGPLLGLGQQRKRVALIALPLLRYSAARSLRRLGGASSGLAVLRCCLLRGLWRWRGTASTTFSAPACTATASAAATMPGCTGAARQFERRRACGAAVSRIRRDAIRVKLAVFEIENCQNSSVNRRLGPSSTSLPSSKTSRPITRSASWATRPAIR